MAVNIDVFDFENFSSAYLLTINIFLIEYDGIDNIDEATVPEI